MMKQFPAIVEIENLRLSEHSNNYSNSPPVHCQNRFRRTFFLLRVVFMLPIRCQFCTVDVFVTKFRIEFFL